MSPDRLADELRLKHPRCTRPPVDIVSITRRYGIQILQWAFIDSEICGLLHWIDNVPVIILNARHSWARKRFTLAHELYHYLVNMPSPQAALMFKRGNPPKNAERNADRFAACLLMEAGLVSEFAKRGLSADAIARRLCVSKSAMGIRLKELELVTNTKAGVRE